MPARNRIKEYIADSYYHIYNRGVNKNRIFSSDLDYNVYRGYLKEYLLPKDVKGLNKILTNPTSNSKQKDKALKLLRLNNFSETIQLLAYCLMPNHIHFLIKQNNEDAMDRFMNSIQTRYSMYFNRQNKRVGPVFQGVYKAVLVISDEQLLYLTKYIHQNPSEIIGREVAQENYLYTSLRQYFGVSNEDWVKHEEVLEIMTQNHQNAVGNYRKFMSDQDQELMVVSISKVTID